MPMAEFGIINDIENYSSNPEDYHCILIDDDLYIGYWQEKLSLLKTFFHSINRPDFGLARCGITLIPPESLPAFEAIVLSDKRINKDEQLIAFSKLIHEAIIREKYIVHFGV